VSRQPRPATIAAIEGGITKLFRSPTRIEKVTMQKGDAVSW
jgi:hypothetical protein